MKDDVMLARVGVAVLVAATLILCGVTGERLAALATGAWGTAANGCGGRRKCRTGRLQARQWGEESCARSAAGATSAEAAGSRDGSQEGSAEREAAERAAGVQEATLFGIPLESPSMIGFVVVGSVVLAAAVCLRPRIVLLLLSVVVLSLLAGFFDLREIPFQAARETRSSRTPVAG